MKRFAGPRRLRNRSRKATMRQGGEDARHRVRISLCRGVYSNMTFVLVSNVGAVRSASAIAVPFRRDGNLSPDVLDAIQGFRCAAQLER
jgi:hypothetical protein